MVAISLKILLAVLCVALAKNIPEENFHSIANDNSGINMFYIGSVDGKSYFAEDSPGRNWAAANTYCKSSGMRLASVESSAQYTLIKSKSNTTGFSDEYWTAGVDAGGNHQMKWKATNEMTSATFAPIELYIGEQIQCITYNAHPNYKHFHIHKCDVLNGVLCETPPAL